MADQQITFLPNQPEVLPLFMSVKYAILFKFKDVETIYTQYLIKKAAVYRQDLKAHLSALMLLIISAYNKNFKTFFKRYQSLDTFKKVYKRFVEDKDPEVKDDEIEQLIAEIPQVLNYIGVTEIARPNQRAGDDFAGF